MKDLRTPGPYTFSMNLEAPLPLSLPEARDEVQAATQRALDQTSGALDISEWAIARAIAYAEMAMLADVDGVLVTEDHVEMAFKPRGT